MFRFQIDLKQLNFWLDYNISLGNIWTLSAKSQVLVNMRPTNSKTEFFLRDQVLRTRSESCDCRYIRRFQHTVSILVSRLDICFE